MMAIRSQSFGLARRNFPQLYTGYYTFQAGVPWLPPSPINGGGYVVDRPPVSTFQPVVYPYKPPTQSVSGGGYVITNPLRLTRLAPNPGAGGNM